MEFALEDSDEDDNKRVENIVEGEDGTKGEVNISWPTNKKKASAPQASTKPLGKKAIALAMK